MQAPTTEPPAKNVRASAFESTPENPQENPPESSTTRFDRALFGVGLEEFLSYLQDSRLQNSRILGMDPGKKRLGLAISDREKNLAVTLPELHRSQWKKDLQTLRELCAEKDVGGIVIGLPIHMDGSGSPGCRATKQLAHNILLGGLHLPIHFRDERLSTQAVKKLLEDDPKSRKKHVDSAAAAFILQGLLDQLHRTPSTPNQRIED